MDKLKAEAINKAVANARKSLSGGGLVISTDEAIAWMADKIEALESDALLDSEIIEKRGQGNAVLSVRNNLLVERLEIEQAQFKHIRLYTQDGELACVCADHETSIKELLSSFK